MKSPFYIIRETSYLRKGGLRILFSPETARAKAQEIHEKIVKWRRDLHQIPETGVDTPETEAFICSQLDDMGIQYRKGIGEHGIVALIEGKNKGKVFGIRADIDGLPIKEETGLPFASTNGNMHACGHDAHAAMGLGTALILSQNEDELEGTVKIIFQPGEEGCKEGAGGARRMIDDGALEDPKVDAIVGLHTGCIWDEGIKLGEVAVRYGSTMACMDRFEITVKGKGSHGAYPHGSIDPISIGSQIVTELQTIVSRELDPLEPGVVTIGEFHAGTAFNIIPGECRLLGTVRALNQKNREFIAKRIEEIAAKVAEGMRGSIEFKYGWEGPPPLVNNDEMTSVLESVSMEVLGNEKVKQIQRPSMGGEDFAFFLEEVPGTFFFLPGCNREKGQVYPHHNSKFDIDEDMLWIGPAVFSAMAFEWLKNNS